MAVGLSQLSGEENPPLTQGLAQGHRLHWESVEGTFLELSLTLRPALCFKKGNHWQT